MVINQQGIIYGSKAGFSTFESWIKHLGTLVLETNGQGFVFRAWATDDELLESAHRLYVGRYVTDLYKKISHETLQKIKDCLLLRQAQELVFRGSDSLGKNVPVAIRFIPAFYNVDLVLMVINYPQTDEDEIREKHWRLAVEAAGDGLWDVNLRIGKIYFSDSLRRILGFAEEEVGNELDDAFGLIHKDDIDGFRTAIDDHVQGRTTSLFHEHRVRTRDGSYKWLLSRGRVLNFDEDNKPVRIVGIEIDISNIKETEDSLRKVHDSFQSAFRYSSIGIALVSPEGRWLEVNNSLCRMLGYTQEEFLGMSFQDITYPEDLEKDLELVQQVLKGEIETYSLEKRYISKDHHIVWALLKVSLVRRPDGSPDFFISQVIDITQEKELRLQLGENNEKLTATTKELEEKLARIEELNYMIAHNLRGPVGNISMIINSIRNNEGIFSFEESMDHIVASSNALIQSLDTLMEFSKIKLNTSIPYEACNVWDLISQIKTQLHSVIFSSNATFELQAALDTIFYPRQYLESILYNLISNALKYAKKGVPPVIRITLRKEGDRTVLTVADNGIGIDLEKYGNKLFKLNGILHQGYDSKGLGLFLTRTQIESLGGSISVRSEVGKGTEFIVIL